MNIDTKLTGNISLNLNKIIDNKTQLYGTGISYFTIIETLKSF